MSASPFRSSLRLVRAQIESRISPPALIVVTSAARGDGKSVTASGLADSFISAHYRTLMVRAGDARSMDVAPDEKIPEPTANLSARKRSERFDEITIPSKSAEAFSREAVQLLVDEFRSTYDYTIIDTPALFEDGAALLFASAASGTLITVRMERARVSEDFRLYAALEAVNAPVLGVVGVSDKVIDGFAKAEPKRVAALTALLPSQLRLRRHPVEVSSSART